MNEITHKKNKKEKYEKIRSAGLMSLFLHKEKEDMRGYVRGQREKGGEKYKYKVRKNL